MLILDALARMGTFGDDFKHRRKIRKQNNLKFIQILRQMSDRGTSVGGPTRRKSTVAKAINDGLAKLTVTVVNTRLRASHKFDHRLFQLRYLRIPFGLYGFWKGIQCRFQLQRRNTRTQQGRSLDTTLTPKRLLFILDTMKTGALYSPSIENFLKTRLSDNSF